MQRIYDMAAVVLSTGHSANPTSGGRSHKMLCPFHQEKTPSMTLYSDGYHCFGCGAHGGPIKWVMEIEGLTYGEAKDWLDGVKRGPVRAMPKNNTPPPKITNEIIRYWSNLLISNGEVQWFLDRGLTMETIKNQGFGWNGKRYTIPIWKGEPFNSEIVQIRTRRAKGSSGTKYLSTEGLKSNYLYGCHPVQWKSHVVCFAGELDATLAWQDGLPVISTVGGKNSIHQYPKNWPDLWLPNTKILTVIFDKGEEFNAALLATEWASTKGFIYGQAAVWEFSDCKDYTEMRQMGGTPSDFLHMLNQQISFVFPALSQF